MTLGQKRLNWNVSEVILDLGLAERGETTFHLHCELQHLSLIKGRGCLLTVSVLENMRKTSNKAGKAPLSPRGCHFNDSLKKNQITLADFSLHR